MTADNVTTKAEQLAASKSRAIAALEDWTEHVDPCENGHVEHGPDAHKGRHLVHSMAGGFGADWDYDEAVAFINAAVRVSVSPFGSMASGLGHNLSVQSPEGRWVSFATKREATA